jgi:hypothetical protein
MGDIVRLALDEISFYGATSAQVLRRMNALVAARQHSSG